GADDGHHLAGGHVQIDAIQQRLAAEGLGQLPHLDHPASRLCRLARSSRRCCAQDSPLASTQSMSAAARYRVKISKVRAVISCAWRNSSGTWMVAASEVSLTRDMKLLPIGGRAVRAAWGRITRRRVWPPLMPMLAAASHWPRSMAPMAPRRISER